MITRDSGISYPQGCQKSHILTPYTTVTDHVTMGDFNVFNIRTGIGHDASLGDYNSLMSAVDINGFVRIGSFTYFGDRASIMEL